MVTVTNIIFLCYPDEPPGDDSPLAARLVLYVLAGGVPNESLRRAFRTLVANGTRSRPHGAPRVVPSPGLFCVFSA